ncbi:zinc finger protein 423 homolog isoform X2 [Coccinella septempunctata]|uniref:zinc finger protein 423 homolog isoform X2 n=1 Tax=Coccinella septempunctata TaxID=41139 RepID=UPI001D07B776|nr:zinc finger protein 423 homolog isoform X2 [Coccinella septempunctata]
MSRRKQANPAKLGDDDYSELTDGVSRAEENIEALLRIRTFTEREERQCRTCTRHTRSQSSSPPIKRERADIHKSFSDGETSRLEEPYECGVCYLKFSRSTALDVHMQSHTDHLQFTCSYCPRLFKHKRSRDRHTKLHTGDKKYKCSSCDSAFSRSDHLKIHMRTHDSKKPFRCETCNRGYNSAAALSTHLQIHTKLETSSGSRTSRSTPSPSANIESFVKQEFAQDPPNFTPLSATAIPIKIGCYLCSREFSSLERLQAHICVRHPQDGRNGATPTSSSASSGQPQTGNGLVNNSSRESFLYSVRNATPRPCTITRPKPLDFRPQTEPTDLTTKLDNDTGATVMKRRRTDSDMVASPYACGETSETVEAYTTHCFDHYIVQSTGFCCTICRILFQTEEESVNHYQEVHVISLFRCIVCGEVLENSMALQIHYGRHHKAYCSHSSCKLCPNLIFQDRLSVQFHISMVHFKQCFRNQNANDQEQSYTSENNIYHQSPQALPAPSLTPQPLTQPSSISSGVLYANIDTPDGAYQRSPPKNYTCDICNLTDIPSEAELHSHKKLQHSKSKTRALSLQCAYCKETFKSRNELESHMKNHQVVYGKGKHKCNICDAIFPSSVTLADHKLTHCKIIEGSICVQCKGSLKDEQSFYDHQLLHSTNPAKTNSQIGFPANCVICCQTLQNTIELNNHASFHLKHLLRKHICTVCNETFDAPSNQNGEQKKEIFNHVLSICSKCSTEEGPRFPAVRDTDTKDSKGKLRYNYENGQSVSVNEKNNLECRSCKQVFPSPGKLQTHLIEHNFVGMNQYSCYICSSVFTGADGLRNHMLGHGFQSKPYECPFCELKYFFRTELDNHIVIHDQASNNTSNNNFSLDRQSLTDAKETNKYETCMYCRNVFSKNSFFIDHLKNCTVRIEMNNAVKDNKIKQENVDPADFSNKQ